MKVEPLAEGSNTSQSASVHLERKAILRPAVKPSAVPTSRIARRTEPVSTVFVLILAQCRTRALSTRNANLSTTRPSAIALRDSKEHLKHLALAPTSILDAGPTRNARLWKPASTESAKILVEPSSLARQRPFAKSNQHRPTALWSAFARQEQPVTPPGNALKSPCRKLKKILAYQPEDRLGCPTALASAILSAI